MLRRAFFPDRLVQCSLRLRNGTLVVPPWVVIRPQSPPPPCFHPHCPDEIPARHSREHAARESPVANTRGPRDAGLVRSVFEPRVGAKVRSVTLHTGRKCHRFFVGFRLQRLPGWLPRCGHVCDRHLQSWRTCLRICAAKTDPGRQRLVRRQAGRFSDEFHRLLSGSPCSRCVQFESNGPRRPQIPLIY